MSEMLMNWPSPDVIARRRRLGLVVGSLVFALVALVAAMALVHAFDVVSREASTAQLTAEGGRLYRTACACYSGFRLPLPDWRSLSIWSLAMGAATIGWTSRRR